MHFNNHVLRKMVTMEINGLCRDSSILGTLHHVIFFSFSHKSNWSLVDAMKANFGCKDHIYLLS